MTIAELVRRIEALKEAYPPPAERGEYAVQARLFDLYEAVEPGQLIDKRVRTVRFDEVACQEIKNCGWPECECPRKIDAHSPEAVSYAFNKAVELLKAAGLEETAAILREHRPRAR